MPPDLCHDLGKGLLQLIISGSSIDLAGWPISACARVSGANLEHGVEARRNRVRFCSRLLSLLATVDDRWAQSGSVDVAQAAGQWVGAARRAGYGRFGWQ